ncbi:MAG: LytR C-terminal domain-containing protein [Gemmatimonadota bacterium]|nr:LytR C-terminal domain-containing protein [Gemmatimonadota bacterium]
MARTPTRGSKRGRSGKKSGGRRSKAKRRGSVHIAFERFKSLITTVTLLATGALIGSWWIAWREADVPDQQTIEFETAEPDRRLKVEVLNGSGERGAADRVGDLLLSLNYDVVTVDNADHFDYGVSHILDRSGAGVMVSELGRRIGADSIVVAIEPDLLLDVTVMLGSDWRRLLADR